jgi:hypothetical protein
MEVTKVQVAKYAEIKEQLEKRVISAEPHEVQESVYTLIHFLLNAEPEKIKDWIKIDKGTYRTLNADSEFLAALQGAGVDNWEGYSEACRADDE